LWLDVKRIRFVPIRQRFISCSLTRRAGGRLGKPHRFLSFIDKNEAVNPDQASAPR
jgi:hypothetical protein